MEIKMRKWEYLVLVENVRSLKSLEDLAKDDELYADQLRRGNYAPCLNKSRLVSLKSQTKILAPAS